MASLAWTGGLILVLIVAAALAAAGGCSGVQLSAEYSGLLDRTAALSDATATAAERGQLTPGQMTQSLRGQSDVWQHFRAGRDGVASTQPMRGP